MRHSEYQVLDKKIPTRCDEVQMIERSYTKREENVQIKDQTGRNTKNTGRGIGTGEQAERGEARNAVTWEAEE